MQTINVTMSINTTPSTQQVVLPIESTNHRFIPRRAEISFLPVTLPTININFVINSRNHNIASSLSPSTLTSSTPTFSPTANYNFTQTNDAEIGGTTTPTIEANSNTITPTT